MKRPLLQSALGFAFLLAACSPEGTTVSGSGGANPGSGGAAPSSGGAIGSSGGAIGSGGSTPQTGGAPGTGGASTGSGGRSGSGGAAPGTGGGATGGRGTGGATGTGGGASTGGASGTGGMMGMAGRSGTGGQGTGGSGGTTSGTCQKGQTKGSDVVIMGESFYAIPPQYIQTRMQDNARKAGALGASDKYRNVAVSAQNMNYIATTEWTAATSGGATTKYVIMDGGGIDCLNGSSCPTCSATFKTLLGKMATAGVQDVIYTRYPEPGNPPGSDTKLKSCLDSIMPGMETTCTGSTSPRCHWLDLRPVWVNGDTTDGLHPTTSGGNHVGDAIWSEMVKDCVAQ